MTGTMTHNILLTRLQGGKTILLTRDGVLKDPYRRHHWPAEEGRMTPTLAPFVQPGSLQSPTFCWMLCDPSVFYRIWFWPSADAESTKPDHDEKSLHRHTIPCFASSKSPFGLQLGSRETPHASHDETEEERCLRRNQRRAAHAFWVRCEPSTPRRDPKTGGLARSSRRRAQPFLPTHCCSESNQACLPGPPCSSSHEGATHSVQVARWARTRSCSRSSILAPNYCESGSPPPSSHAARWEDQKRNPPLAPDTVPSEAMKGHWTQEGYEGPFGTRRQTVLRPKGLRRPSAFGSELRRGKVRLAFRLHTESPVKTRPRYASLSASQWLSRSGIPRPPLRVRWIQTCLRTISLAPPQSNLERDRCSANRCALGRGSTANR